MNLLRDILYGVNLISVKGSTNLDVKKIEFDSRKVSSGDVFVAIPGHNDDGQKYIIDAIKNGAIAVIFETKHEKFEDRCNFNPRKKIKGSSRNISIKFFTIIPLKN